MSASLLVVDDEPLNLEIIQEYLDGEPFDLTLAESGDEAWKILDASPESFSAVLLDRMMPGMSGIDLLRKIKADPRLEHLPVIMQTAAAAPEQVAEGLNAGAYYYLIKPFERATLLSIILAALDDVSRWSDLRQRVTSNVLALQRIDTAEFSFRTLHEAEALAGLISQLAAEPDSALMGLAEILVNGVEHGNLGIDFAEKSRLKMEDGWAAEVERRLGLPENSEKRVRISISREADHWCIVVRDEGPGFDWQSFIELAPERAFAPNGRGIVMARKLAFLSVEYKGCGNTVELRMSASTRD
ncbi:response regulator [Viridibacterium curvum]|uniref:Response regulatory domain-containing protein n=1 Tax=Viridibacterium curvum TaxID=1101404 RepID=A0ABP9QYX7_9RHOO